MEVKEVKEVKNLRYRLRFRRKKLELNNLVRLKAVNILAYGVAIGNMMPYITPQRGTTMWGIASIYTNRSF